MSDPHTTAGGFQPEQQPEGQNFTLPAPGWQHSAEGQQANADTVAAQQAQQTLPERFDEAQQQQHPQHHYQTQYAHQAPFAAPGQQGYPHGYSGQQAYPAEKKQHQARPRSQRGGIGVLSFLLVLLVSVGAGFGGSALYNYLFPPVTSSNPSGNITINNPDSVSVVTAVAAKALPAVVTLQVSTETSGGTGSGVIISEDGYVLTNNHVVSLDSGTSTIIIKDHEGTLYPADIIATDPLVDLAVVKIDAPGKVFTVAEFADSEALNVGDFAVVIGSPLGYEGSVTYGVLSALNRSISLDPVTMEEAEEDEESGVIISNALSIPVIQTDAAINRGNSGGALLDAQGRLIGINVAIVTSGGASNTGNIGLGFAIPGNLAQRVANELITNGKASHGRIGAVVRTADLSDSIPAVAGAVIMSRDEDSPAALAGLQVGDIIISVGAKRVDSSTDLAAQVRYYPADVEVELGYVRDGTFGTVTVVLGESVA